MTELSGSLLILRRPSAAGAAQGRQSSVQSLAEEAASWQQHQPTMQRPLLRVQVSQGRKLGEDSGHTER